MKNYLIIPALIAILSAGCKGKKETKEDAPISALSIIKGQLNKLDTSLYAFTKYEKTNDKADTTYLKREEVRQYTGPFLSLPDIADKTNYKKYNEEKLIDAQTDLLSIISTLKDDENSEVLKQIMVIDVNDVSEAKVHSIFIDRNIASSDSIIEQKLFWQVDKYFTINSAVIKENQPDKTHFLKVTWQ
ncbi:MAG TPA: hypothetical protein VF144_01215 [Chitinophagaceae bacterium]